MQRPWLAWLQRVWLKIPESVRDALWPSVVWTDKEAKEELIRRERRARWEDAIIQELTWRSEEELRQAVDKCKEILDSERERGAGVERRLTGYLTLSSIGAAAAIVTLLQQVVGDSGRSPLHLKLVSFGAIAMTLYIVLQVVCSSLAAVRGLKRRAYSEPSADGLLPYPCESSSHLAQRHERILISRARSLRKQFRKSGRNGDDSCCPEKPSGRHSHSDASSDPAVFLASKRIDD